MALLHHAKLPPASRLRHEGPVPLLLQPRLTVQGCIGAPSLLLLGTAVCILFAPYCSLLLYTAAHSPMVGDCQTTLTLPGAASKH